ncbi:unnamed protein product [Diamesa tonsa]
MKHMKDVPRVQLVLQIKFAMLMTVEIMEHRLYTDDNDCGYNLNEDDIHCAQRTCPQISDSCPNHRCIPATWYWRLG